MVIILLPPADISTVNFNEVIAIVRKNTCSDDAAGQCCHNY